MARGHYIRTSNSSLLKRPASCKFYLRHFCGASVVASRGRAALRHASLAANLLFQQGQAIAMVVFSFLGYPDHPRELPGPKTVATLRTRLPSSTHVQVLYPCPPENGSRKVTEYMRTPAVDNLATLAGLPSCMFRHLDKGPFISHPSPHEAPVLTPSGDGGRWPIIVFSHGTWGCEEM